MTYRIEYGNDVGDDDGSFWEWWTVTDDTRSFKCEAEADAIWLRDLLNGLRPLFDAQDAARDKPALKTRAESARFVLFQLEDHDYKCPFEKGRQHHYGKQDLKCLLDFIYGGPPNGSDEVIK
jgi:hypothetical protein